MRDTEERMGLDPIAVLLARRHALVREVAPLRARFGPGGTWDAERKIQLASIAQLLRAEAQLEGKRITESAVDDAAHSDGRYTDYVTQATTDRARWAELEDRVQAITDLVNRGNVVARYLTAEAHL